VNIKRLIVCGLTALPMLAGVAGQAGAQDLVPGASFQISCENGQNYVLQSPPSLFPGETVTAQLHLGPHHVVPMRLIPMGDGYRYAGRGVWLDGIREHALLYLSKYQPMACLVDRI